MFTFIYRLKERLFREREWQIIFYQQGFDELVFDAFSYSDKKREYKVELLKVKESGYSWFADPFILDVTEDEIILLVEEFDKQQKKGHITRLIVDRETKELKQRDKVLSLKTHFSFPYIVRKGADVYIMPENCKSGRLRLFWYNVKENTAHELATLVDEPLDDAVFTDCFGEDLIFSTKHQDKPQKELYIYARNESSDFFCLMSKIELKRAVARNAGGFFRYNSDVYRVAQDCENMYGERIVFQRVKRETFETNDFIIEDSLFIEAKDFGLKGKTHTFTTYKNVCVGDFAKLSLFQRVMRKLF